MEPDETAKVSGCESWCTAHLWIVPAKVGGTWESCLKESLALKQTFQMYFRHPQKRQPHYADFRQL